MLLPHAPSRTGFLSPCALRFKPENPTVTMAETMLFQEVARGTEFQQVAEELPERLTKPAIFVLVGVGGQLAFELGAVVPAWLWPISFRERLGLLTARPSWSVYPLAMFGSLVPSAIGLGLAEALPFIRSLRPDLDHKQVIKVVEQGADDLGEPGWEKYTGHGRINFHNSPRLAKDWQTPDE